jgi:hypothetical protein
MKFDGLSIYKQNNIFINYFFYFFETKSRTLLLYKNNSRFESYILVHGKGK